MKHPGLSIMFKLYCHLFLAKRVLIEASGTIARKLVVGYDGNHEKSDFGKDWESVNLIRKNHMDEDVFEYEINCQLSVSSIAPHYLKVQTRIQVAVLHCVLQSQKSTGVVGNIMYIWTSAWHGHRRVARVRSNRL